MSDRSNEALRERLEMAKKATPKGEGTLWTVDGAVRGYLCIRDAFNEHLLTIEDSADMATAQHIAANHPDVVRADIEEILALRAEVARLEDEVASLEQEQKFSDETEYALIRKLFDLKICHKETICEQADAQELNFEGESGCLFCWRQWAIRKAREAESEGENL